MNILQASICSFMWFYTRDKPKINFNIRWHNVQCQPLSTFYQCNMQVFWILFQSYIQINFYNNPGGNKRLPKSTTGAVSQKKFTLRISVSLMKFTLWICLSMDAQIWYIRGAKFAKSSVWNVQCEDHLRCASKLQFGTMPQMHSYCSCKVPALDLIVLSQNSVAFKLVALPRCTLFITNTNNSVQHRHGDVDRLLNKQLHAEAQQS